MGSPSSLHVSDARPRRWDTWRGHSSKKRGEQPKHDSNRLYTVYCTVEAESCLAENPVEDRVVDRGSGGGGGGTWDRRCAGLGKAWGRPGGRGRGIGSREVGRLSLSGSATTRHNDWPGEGGPHTARARRRRTVLHPHTHDAAARCHFLLFFTHIAHPRLGVVRSTVNITYTLRVG